VGSLGSHRIISALYFLVIQPRRLARESPLGAPYTRLCSRSRVRSNPACRSRDGLAKTCCAGLRARFVHFGIGRDFNVGFAVIEELQVYDQAAPLSGAIYLYAYSN